MLTSRICREHSAKCIHTANSLPPGPQREMFLDMAHSWTLLAAKIENTEVLDQAVEADETRFGSRIIALQSREEKPRGGDQSPESFAAVKESSVVEGPSRPGRS